MYDSKAYYGGAFLENEDLEESNIRNKIELEYYTTKNTKEDIPIYGIEIIKKEYRSNRIDTESSKQYITNNKDRVIEIIKELKKHKVTPIGLNDVVEDLLKLN